MVPNGEAMTQVSDMRIWRIERLETGMGPFNDIRCEEWLWTKTGTRLSNAYAKSGRFPSPQRDASEAGKFEALETFAPFCLDTVRVGTQDQKTLGRWFPKYVQPMLANLGFKRVEYDVPDEHSFPLKHQILFKPEYAMRLKVEPLVA